MNNPFSVITPENISSDEIKNLFVESPDFLNLQKKGHTFIHGHRGCGKSMSLQVLRTKNFIKYKNITKVEDLKFISMYIPIKKSVLANIELDRLKDDVLEKYFSEHMLCLHFAINICKELNILVQYDILNLNETEVNNFLQNLNFLGFDISLKEGDNIFLVLQKAFERQWLEDNKIRRNISLIRNKEDIIEPSIFTTYHDFLLPLVEFIKNMDLNGLLNKDIYLLVDDADNLPLIFTKTLNEWVLYRDIDSFSLKISTQLKYKTSRTISNNRIEKPHDYSEIVFSYVVSSEKKKEYQKLIKEIVEKRLNLVGLQTTAEDFLPGKEKQLEEINKIREEYIKKWDEGKGKGNQRTDDATRYAIPDYIKKLGEKKQKSNYSYSGFKQLVNISGGIVRHFLEPLSVMYEVQKNKTTIVTNIDSSIQDDVIKDLSDSFFTDQFEDLEKDLNETGEYDEKIKKLRNLITVLGENFHAILLSNLSERRIFSFTISDDHNIDKELKEILKLGVEYGLLYESKIGRKNSYGRTNLYILTRLLAPHFTLDPNGFSGYQSLTTTWIKQALINPNLKLKKLNNEDNESLNNIQPKLPGL